MLGAVSAGGVDHPRADGHTGRLVDEDERAGGAVLEYESTSSGTVVRSWMRPISLSPSSLVSLSRWSVLTSSRYCTSLTSARAERVVCLMASFCRGRRGVVVIQQTIASMSWLGFGALLTRASMSPRETSTSSSRRTVTDIGGKAR